MVPTRRKCRYLSENLGHRSTVVEVKLDFSIDPTLYPITPLLQICIFNITPMQNYNAQKLQKFRFTHWYCTVRQELKWTNNTRIFFQLSSLTHCTFIPRLLTYLMKSFFQQTSSTSKQWRDAIIIAYFFALKSFKTCFLQIEGCE